MAGSLIDGVDERTVELIPTTEGFGELAVVFLDVPPHWNQGRSGVPQLFVELRQPEGTLQFRICDGYDQGRLRIPGIPHGRYELRMRGIPSTWLAMEPPIEVEIRDPSQEVVLDFRAAGGVELDVVRQSGQRHQGFVRASAIYFGKPGEDSARELSEFRPAVLRDFLEEPYLVYPLTPGRYQIALQHPFGFDAHGVPTTVDVAPGAIEHVVLREGR